MIGILGKKVGMTQVYDEKGKLCPVTVVEALPSSVLTVRSKEKNGYCAIQLGIVDFKKKTKNSPGKKFIREVKVDEGHSYKAGDVINADVFSVGDFVDIVASSKGKGFQGGMKRWGWSGGEGGHGSMHHRRIGSIGASSFPSRVHRGKTMPGHMGNKTRTVQNLMIMSVDKENNIMAVNGSVPGHNGTFLMIKEAIKKPRKQEKKDEANK